MSGISVGKIRGLQQLSTPRGIFSILAIDQRGTLRRMMETAGHSEVGYDAMVRAKVEIVSRLAQVATGVLLDPEYGAAPTILHRALPGSVGLVVAVEATGYDERGGDRLARLLEGWGVDKIKAIGASAVKMLVYYNPRREAAARHQRDIIRRVAADCRRYDIPFMVEPIVYPTDDGDKASFARERETLIIESAREIGALGVDLLKMEFPVALGTSQDPGYWQEACVRLTEAAPVPWALLSAGVDFATYERQLTAACRAGASGFVAGRAIWKEAVSITDPAERQAFLDGEMVQRMRRLREIADTQGRPWHEVASHAYSPSGLSEDWYTRYSGLAMTTGRTP